jgi:uncharacterized protein (TIGR02186 family)
MKALGLIVVLLLAFSPPVFSAPRGSVTDPLVIDLSSHVVAINSNFAGVNLLLFGAVDGVADGNGDVVVVIRGPTQSELIRRRSRLLGLWINRYQATIGEAPSYYQVASTRPLDHIAAKAMLDRHRLGVEHLGLAVKRKDDGRTDDDYREALIRLKTRQGLYGELAGKISLLDGRLFRTDMNFPANVPTGIYTAEVYLVRDGEIVSAQTTPLIISKIGVGADIFDIASRHAALYGLAAVGLAILGGWLAATAFRKG